MSVFLVALFTISCVSVVPDNNALFASGEGFVIGASPPWGCTTCCCACGIVCDCVRAWGCTCACSCAGACACVCGGCCCCFGSDWTSDCCCGVVAPANGAVCFVSGSTVAAGAVFVLGLSFGSFAALWNASTRAETELDAPVSISSSCGELPPPWGSENSGCNVVSPKEWCWPDTLAARAKTRAATSRILVAVLSVCLTWKSTSASLP